jgi:hypothetical protein
MDGSFGGRTEGGGARLETRSGQFRTGIHTRSGDSHSVGGSSRQMFFGKTVHLVLVFVW